MDNSTLAVLLGTLAIATLMSASLVPAHAQLPPGMADHGAAAPIGTSAWGGTMATEDADGSRLVFMKLWSGGGSSYLFINAETGETEQIDTDGLTGLGAYLVILSPENKVYDTMGNWMLEIDVPTREIRRLGQLPGGMSLAFTMDDEGVIYAGIFPSATLITYDPRTDTFTDYGPVYEDDFPLYYRPIAVDDAGWVYGGIAIKAAQVVGFNPATGEKRTYVPEDQRQQGAGTVFRGTDGKVYANAPGWSHHVLYAGEATPIEEPPVEADRVVRTWSEFSDDTRLSRMDVHNRFMDVMDEGAEQARRVQFDYDCPGLSIFTMAAGPDGKIWGATGLPLRIWCFDPQTGDLDNWGLGAHTGHANQMVRQGDRIYGAVYSSGSLIELDVTQPVHDVAIRQSTNPRHVHGYEYGFGGEPDMYGRPHAMVAHPDGRHIVMGGSPARAQLGGGLIIYDTQTGEYSVLKPDELLPDQGVNAMCVLPDGDIIVGSTIGGGTGASASTATTAMLYRIDWATQEMTESWPIEPASGSVRDLVVGHDGLVYGLAAGNRFFCFNPETGQMLHDEEVSEYGSVTGSQAPRTMAVAPDGGIYVLFRDAIARFEPGTCEHREIARPGSTITAGVLIHEGRLYFACGTRLYSQELNLAQ
ncbi:MAG: hypothetical protein GX358_00145 [candidate division WS1 bacterium]|nr:hypothetical protein [candidate division WS1 bacterium]